MKNYNKLSQQISKEESFYPLIARGELEHKTAHFLATHHTIRNQWKEDLCDFQRLNYST